MNRTLVDLVLTHLKYYKRNRSVLMGTLAFPLIFIGVFGIAFQYSDPTTSTIQIGIINDDNGIPQGSVVLSPFGEPVTNNLSGLFATFLEHITYENNKTEVFKVKEYTKAQEQTALDDLNSRDIMALIHLGNDFSLGYMAAFRQHNSNDQALVNYTNSWFNYPNPSYVTQIEISGDQSLQAFATTANVVTNVVDYFFNPAQEGRGAFVVANGTFESKGLTAFDYVLPGLVIFAILNTLSVVAQVSLRDVESGLINRLRISKVDPSTYTLSIIIGQLIVSLVQIPIMFAAGFMFGFEYSANIGLAFVFAVFVSLSMSGIGLMIASLGKNQEAAGAIGSMISTPMAFLASVFFIVPNPTIIAKGGIFGSNSLGVMDLLPPTSAITALRMVLLSGSRFTDVIFYFGLIAVLTVLYLLLGIAMYSRKHLSAK